MYVTAPKEKWIMKLCGFKNTAATTTAVESDLRKRGFKCVTPIR